MTSGVLCPECGSRKTKTQSTGFSDEGHRLRRRRCLECGAPSFLTVEVPVDATWGELETSYRLHQREYYRKRQGYQGMTAMSRTRQTARLVVKIRVIRNPKT